MKLTANHISKLLKRKEDERVEFKRTTSALPENIWETYSAFCNADGGAIILGISEGKNNTYSIEGVSDARNTAVFNIFALVDIGERSGMGLANLHGLWKKYGYAEPEITEFHDQGRIVIVVTTDDDTVNDTVTRPENGFETDQNPIRSVPEVDNKVDDTAEGDNKTGSVGDNNSFRGDNKYEQRRPFAELITPLYLTDFGTGTKLLVARYGHE